MTRALHDAAVERARQSFLDHPFDPATDGDEWETALIGAVVASYLAHLAEAGWKVVPKSISDEHLMRAVNSVNDGVIDGWSWDILHAAAPAWPPAD